LTEFWEDNPAQEELIRTGLIDVPLLSQSKPDNIHRNWIGERILTAKEDLLLKYLTNHSNSVCEKDELIRAVWSEDVIFDRGIRDESLAQLVRRLRMKVEANPSDPKVIQTVPGRGYILRKES